MLPSTSIAVQSTSVLGPMGKGVFSKLSPSDNITLNRQHNQEDLQFPQDLGENEYNQFILFTSYETAGSKISSQARSKRREALALGEDIDIAKIENVSLVRDATDFVMYQERQVEQEEFQGIPFLPAPVAPTAFETQDPGEAYAYYRPGLVEETEEALREVKKLTTRQTEATAGADEAEREAGNIIGIKNRIKTGRNHEDFINDRSRSTIEQQKLLGIERRVSSEGRMRLTSATSKSNTNIALYLPNKLVNSGTIGYNNVDFELLQAGAGVVNELSKGEVIKASGSALGLGSRVLASIVDGIAGIGGVNPNTSAALQQVTGLAINPRQQQTFQGVQTRGFDFTFSFAPKNQKEAVEVSKIIRAFRKLSHPSISHGAFLNVPDEFEIRYYKVFNNGVVAENLFLNKIGRCALQAVNVDYTPNGINATFPDGSPVRTSLTMQFTELRPLVREDIEEGY